MIRYLTVEADDDAFDLMMAIASDDLDDLTVIASPLKGLPRRQVPDRNRAP